MKFPIFELSASVDIRPLPGAWFAELLGRSNFQWSLECPLAVKGLKQIPVNIKTKKGIPNDQYAVLANEK